MWYMVAFRIEMMERKRYFCSGKIVFGAIQHSVIEMPGIETEQRVHILWLLRRRGFQ